MAVSYDDVIAGLKARREAQAAKQAAPPAEPPGVLASFGRGVYRSPANVLGISDMMRRRTSMIPGANGPEPLQHVMDQGQIARSGVGEPQGLMAQTAERIGMQAPLSAGSIAATGIAGGAMAVKDAVIQDLSSNLASQYAKNKGFGMTGQMVAGVVGAMVAPTRVPGFIANRFGKAAEDSADQAGQATTRMLSDSEVMKLAKQYDVKPDDMREVAKIVQDRVIIDPMTGKPQIDDLVRQIDDTMRIFPNPKVRPTAAQTAGKYAGGNMIAAEDAATLTDPIANSRVGGIRDAVQKDLSERWDSLVGEGSTEGAIDKFGSVQASQKAAKAAAWDEVPFDELPKRPAGPITKALDLIKNKRSMLYRNTPSDVKDTIENFGQEVTARDLQDLRSRLGEVIANSEGSFEKSVQFSRESATELRKVVDNELSQLPEDGSRAYRNAVSATKSYYDLFPTDSKAVDALSRFTDRTRIASAVLRADKPAEQMGVAMNIFGKTEGGMEDLRSIFMKHLVGENIGDVSMANVSRALRNEGTSAAYKALLGPEDFASLKDYLKGYQIGTSGTSGTAAQMAKTQSVHLVQKLAEPINSLRQGAKGIAAAADEAITRDAASEAARKGILNEMIFDLGLYRKLLKIPTEGAGEKEVTSWLKSWSIAVARAAVRTQARAASRAPSIARAAVGPMIVNQPLPSNAMGPQQNPGPAMAPQNLPR